MLKNISTIVAIWSLLTVCISSQNTGMILVSPRDCWTELVVSLMADIPVIGLHQTAVATRNADVLRAPDDLDQIESIPDSPINSIKGAAKDAPTRVWSSSLLPITYSQDFRHALMSPLGV